MLPHINKYFATIMFESLELIQFSEFFVEIKVDLIWIEIISLENLY